MEDCEGGFVEILGGNTNAVYRFNISVNDGYREDPNGVPWNKKGKIFWVSNYYFAQTSWFAEHCVEDHFLSLA